MSVRHISIPLHHNEYSFGWIPICANTEQTVSLTARETASEMKRFKDYGSAIATTVCGASRLFLSINYLIGHNLF